MKTLLSHQLENGRPVTESLNAIHVDAEGNKYSIPLRLESSGTQRLLSLLPMLFELANPNNGEAGQKVYVVNELGRCFSRYVNQLPYRGFSNSCNADQIPESNCCSLRMIFCLWNKASCIAMRCMLHSVESLVVPSSFVLMNAKTYALDKDLINSYFEGRFGGIPILSMK